MLQITVIFQFLNHFIFSGVKKSTQVKEKVNEPSDSFLIELNSHFEDEKLIALQKSIPDRSLIKTAKTIIQYDSLKNCSKIDSMRLKTTINILFSLILSLKTYENRAVVF